jgi:hypothetical protein
MVSLFRIYIYVASILLAGVFWALSYHWYYGLTFSLGNDSTFGVSAVAGRVMIGLTSDSFRGCVGSGFNCQRPEEFEEQLSAARAIGLYAPSPSEWPWFSAKRFVSTVPKSRKWERTSVIFPHWIVLLILGGVTLWDGYNNRANHSPPRKKVD